MRDPYLFDDSDVLRNKLNIRDEKLLGRAESDITYIKFANIEEVADGTFDVAFLKKLHKYIFEDIYDWAGQIRTIEMVKGERVLGGDTVRYSYPDNIESECTAVLKEIHFVNWKDLSVAEAAERFAKLVAKLWQIHPFREGNTRTIITFATLFAGSHGFSMNKLLLRDHAAYVRDAFVKASDGQYSEYKYLTDIFCDAIEQG